MEGKEIREWIDRKMPDLTEDLKTICRIRSVADIKDPACKPYGEGCRKVLRDMLELGRAAGFETENFDDYVGRITYPGRQKENIAIWAHLDVVDEGDDWDYSPYEPVIKDGYFIARGCQDNKSSAVMGLYVLKYMKEHGINLEHTLDLYLGTCEEQGMYDLDYFTEHYECPALSLVPDSGFPVCCGERGSFNGELTRHQAVSDELLEISCDCGQYTVPDKAYAILRYTKERWDRCASPLGEATPDNIQVSLDGDRIQISAKGISTQAANPDKGESALTRLSEFLCERKLLPEDDLEVFAMARDINGNHNGDALDVFCEDQLSGPMVMVATQLSLRQEEQEKKTPSEAGKGQSNGKRRPVLGFISKFPVTQSEIPYGDRARQAAEKRGFELKVTRFAKANCFDPEKPAVKRLTQCSNEILGREDAPFVMSGGTYARKLPNAIAFGTGMPLPKRPETLFRPGHGDYHQPDESISLERIRKALEIYITGILRIDELHLQ